MARPQKKTKAAQPPALFFELPPTAQWLLHGSLLWLGLCILYAYTSPPTVALEDDGSFITAAYLLGVSHPPGYPLYSLLAHLFTYIPFGSIAWRVHLFSAVCGAFSCVAVWYLIRGFTQSKLTAWTGALALGLSATLWSQSIIAEVYTLNSALILGCLVCTVYWLKTQSRWSLAGAGLLFGLGISNHWPLLLLASPALLIIAWPQRLNVFKQWTAWLPALCLGLTPYVWMVWRANAAPNLAFYGDIQSFGDFWYYFNRSNYASIDNSSSSNILDKLLFLWMLIRELSWQFAIVGLPAVVIGFVAQWRLWSKQISWALTATFVMGSVILVLLLGFDYEWLFQAIFKVYLIVPWAIAAIWLALGVQVTARWFSSKLSKPALWIHAGLTIGLLAAIFITHVQTNNRHDYRYAETLAKGLLESFAPNAIVFAKGDVSTFTLGYFHMVENIRPDITLLNNYGSISVEPRLFDPKTAIRSERWNADKAYLNQHADRPIHWFGDDLDWSGTDNGMYIGVHRPLKAKTTRTSLAMSDEIHDLFMTMESMPAQSDAWTEYHRQETINNFGRWVILMGHFYPDSAIADKYMQDVNYLTDKYFSVSLNELYLMITNGKTQGIPDLQAKLARAEGMTDYTTKKADYSKLTWLKGKLEMQQNQHAAGEALFLEAIDIWKNEKNPALSDTMFFYAAQRRCNDYLQLRDTYFVGKTMAPDLLQLDGKTLRRCGVQ